MEWNMKEASWDLGGLEEATGLPNIETVNDDGSSRFGNDDRRITGEFCVDLKLGQVGNSNELATVAKWKNVGGVSKVMMTTPSSSSSSSLGSSKRARALNNGGSQPVSCLVDGCNSDLSNCRDYHRRHKVCELHSKTPVVTIGGHKQRFCQQCSRFHSLEEFDEGKRSCRKRLDGHNRRRRKPPPPPQHQHQQAEGVGGCGSFLSNYQQGTHLLPFSGSHMYPSTALAHPAWNSDVRLHHHHHQNQQLHKLADHREDLFLGSLSSPTYTEVSNNNKQQQLVFLQGDHNSTTMENNQGNNDQEALPPPVSVCQTFLRAATPPLPAATLRVDHHDSHCALSLLSSPQTHTSRNGLSQMVQPHHHQHQHQQAMSSVMQQQQHRHQALGLSLHDHGLETADSVMFHHRTDHSPTTMYNMNEATPFPFHWEQRDRFFS